MDLQSKLIQDVMQEAGRRIATIDRNRGMVAECETLAETLNAISGTTNYSPLVTVHEHTINARVIIFFARKNTVLADLKAAGLEIKSETKTYPDSTEPDWKNDITLKLHEFDVAINLSSPYDELKSA